MQAEYKQYHKNNPCRNQSTGICHLIIKNFYSSSYNYSLEPSHNGPQSFSFHNDTGEDLWNIFFIY